MVIPERAVLCTCGKSGSCDKCHGTGWYMPVGRNVCPTGRKILDALESEDLCERDLFIRLRPVDRVALHRLLKEMASSGALRRYSTGHLPGAVVEMWSTRDA